MEIEETVTTGMKVEKRAFTWKIDNFDIVRKSKAFTNSQRFTFRAGKTMGLETEWMFYLRWSDEKVDGVENSWIGIRTKLCNIPKSKNFKEVNAVTELKIKRLDGNENFFHVKSAVRNYIEKGKAISWGWTRALPQDAELNNLPLVDGCLVVQLKFQLLVPTSLIRMDESKSKFATIEDEHKIKFSKKLNHDLGKLLTTGTPSKNANATTKIETRDEKEFAVNWEIISARSPVFERMFHSGMKERKTGVISIPDISSKTMSILLHFIYTGTLHNDWRAPDVVVELVYASDKYELPDLLGFLNDVIGFVCTKENAGKLMSLAKKIPMLKKAETDLLEFMKNNIWSFDDMVSFTQPDDDKYSSDESDGEFVQRLQCIYL